MLAVNLFDHLFDLLQNTQILEYLLAVLLRQKLSDTFSSIKNSIIFELLEQVIATLRISQLSKVA